MMSKWEWIEKACETLNYIESAEWARKIERALKETYGNTKTKNTKAFEGFQERNTLSAIGYYVIRNLASNPAFCIGCEMTTTFGCKDCLFGKKYGFCDHESLYGEFRRMLAKEHEEGNQIPPGGTNEKKILVLNRKKNTLEIRDEGNEFSFSYIDGITSIEKDKTEYGIENHVFDIFNGGILQRFITNVKEIKEEW